ncbi:MAG: hypothetical protein QNJ54_03480 [Prochloraceae cyanobacterium]|nr:hypothetical protein [Prochloraceae cyanobacterium]
MVNQLTEGSNGLVTLDYSDLLKKILTQLQVPENNPFKPSQSGNQLRIDIDEIAFLVASSGNIISPLLGADYNAKSATTNFANTDSKNSFIEDIQKIRNCLTKKLENVLSNGENKTTIEDYIEKIASNLIYFKKQHTNLNFDYNFTQTYKSLQKQRLSFSKQPSSNSPILKGHKLIITVQTGKFKEELQAGVRNYIEDEFSSKDENDREDVNDIFKDQIQQKDSHYDRLVRLMDTEALGKLQREAKIRYLAFIQEHCGDRADIVYIQDLIRRLRLIEEYIGDRNKSDGEYEVNYAGETVNLKDIFSRADAFDMLPIVPLISGYLGEINDENKGEKQFIFGVKLKLGGKVQTEGGKTVFKYFTNLIDSNSKEHKEAIADPNKKKYFVEKVFKIALLYFFIFASKSSEIDLEYNPRESFEQKVLPTFQGNDDDKKRDLWQNIIKGFEKYQVESKIDKLKTLLRKLLKQRSHWQERTYPVNINVKQSILEEEINTILKDNTLFKDVLKQDNLKPALQYIDVSEATVDPSYLCSLSTNIKIEEIRYYSTEDNQTFSMEYDIDKVKALPILVSPRQENCVNIYNRNLKQQKMLLFSYNHDRLREDIFKDLKSTSAFTYKLTFSLLAYISLRILLDSAKQIKLPLFVPILRFQLNKKEESSVEEEFMRSIFAVISHLLNEGHRSNSQGFCIKDRNQFKIRNALSSLYSILPKKFKLNNPPSTCEVNKLAIIVVSSRECDRSKKDNYKITNLIGEIVGLERQEDNTIRLKRISTLSENYNSKEIHRSPNILRDWVDTLYDRRGYRHFFYIAKSPYSNTLNITTEEADDDEKLFFMSKSVIQTLKGEKEDIKIYPVFFDKYYVVKLQNISAKSLYIQDTAELDENLIDNPNKQIAIFFNLFNGITIGKEDRHYNGVMSYATLLNIYEGILGDEDIKKGLIYDGQLKNELLEFLTLFHFSRYEAANNISLKLDPYQNIIGFNSVSALSIFNHANGSVKFNSLAFLTEVKKALFEKRNTEKK